MADKKCGKLSAPGKTERIDLRVRSELKAEIQKLYERLPGGFTVSTTAEEMLRIFLADGLDVAEARIRSGRIDVAARQAELEGIVRATLAALGLRPVSAEDRALFLAGFEDGQRARAQAQSRKCRKVPGRES